MQRLVPAGAVVLALVLLVAASTLAAPSDREREPTLPVAASHEAEPPEEELADEADDGTPSEKLLDRLVTKLGDAGVTTSAAAIAALAADYGVGGAVRILAWAHAAQEAGVGLTAEEIAAMFDSGLGWGEIAAQLNDGNPGLELHPGIGKIMGNAGGQGLGLGRANAPGQQKRQ